MSREQWIEYGIDVQRRTIRLVGDIDERTTDRILTGLHLMRGDRPIHLLINSEGGDDDSCRSIIGAILAHPAPVVGHVIGVAESAASWILQICDKRIMYPHSSIMFHLGDGVKNKHGKWVDGKFVDDVLRRMHERNPEYLRTKLIALVDNDWFVYPSQALELGLVDEVIE